MRQNKIHIVFTAWVLSVLFIAGTTGVRLEKHDCIHCGDKFALSLGSFESSLDCSCCDSDKHEGEEKGQYSIHSGHCCSGELKSYEISDPINIGAEKHTVILFEYQYEQLLQDPSGFICSCRHSFDEFPCRSGRDLVILNSQYRT